MQRESVSQILNMIDIYNHGHLNVIFDYDNDLIKVCDNKNNVVATMSYTYDKVFDLDMIYEPIVTNVSMCGKLFKPSKKVGQKIYRYATENNACLYKHIKKSIALKTARAASEYENYIRSYNFGYRR